MRSYGVVALVRYSKNKYKFISFNDEAEYKSFVEGKTSFEGIKNNFSTGYKTGAANTDEILITVRGNVKQLEKDGKTYYSAESSENDITINNMLSYKSDEPLVMSESNGKYTVYGNGEIKVINSITVWKNEWSFSASENKVYTLNPDAVKQPSTQQMTLSLDGAAFLIQSIGGFLIDLKYGVMTADSDDGLITHGISFGGKISIPIKDPTKKKDNPNPQTQGGNNNNDDDDEDYSEDLTQLFGESEGDRYTTSAVTNRSDFKKDSNFSDGNLSAEIESILYGEKTGEKDGQTVVTDTGFIGINTKISLGLPEDILGKFVENAPGVYASVTINTIDNYYELSAGLKIKVIECEGTLAFKQVNVKDKDVIVPDKIEFYVREGLKIPLAPPLFITGLGGGINGLADTIGGEFDALPPITLLLFARLELIETMIGDFNAAISLSGIDLQGDMKLKNDKKGQVLNLQLGISARWIDPWHLSAYGKISVIDGLIKGTVALIIADNLFYGYAAIAICIPDSVPIIGGKELAGIEAAVSNEFIGANIKIIGIKFGVIYYWSGKFDYGTGIDLAPPMLTSTPEDNGSAGSGEDYTALYGTNIHKLSATKVENTGISLLAAGQSSVTKNFDPEREDALLIEIPFEGTVMPEMEDITLTDPSGNVIPLVADDGNGNGNFLTQSREDGDYIYISITDPSQLKKGDWTVTVTSDYGRIKDFGIYGADSIPEVTSTTFAPRSNVNSRDVKVSWTKSMDYDADTSVDIYVTENPNALEDAKASQSGVKDAFGTSMAHFDYAGVDNCDITLPESFPSGDYYVVTMLSSAKSGISTAISAQPFKFVNNNLPNPIKSAKLYYAGNKALCLNIEDADTVDYTDYLINIIASDGTAVTNSFTQLDKDSELVIGENSELEKGKTYHVEISTLKETDDGKFYYGAEKVVSNDYTIPDVAMPNLISVQTNAENGALTSNTLSVTYKFDGPVYVRSLINGVDTPTGDTNEFKDTWTMTADLVDGDYLIDFKAYNTAKDYVTGENFADIANSTIGLTVDTQAPVLTLTQDVKKNVQNKDAIFGNNVVRAASNGLYTITGLTENDVTLTADGSDENVTIGENNTFTVTGTLETGEMKKEVELRAVDKVGNTSTLIVSVLPDITSYREIKIKSGGQDISKNTDGDKVIELQRFERVPLEVYGVRADGKEVLIDPEDVTWTVLDEKNLIALDNTGAKALRSGTATFKASVGSMLLEDGANISTGQEDYVLFSVNNIVGTEMEILPNFAQTMVLSKANDEDGVRLIAQLKDDAHGDLPVMRAYVATYDDNGKLIKVNSTAFDTSDTVKVTKPAQANYKVFVWADGVGPVIKAITNKTTGVNKLFD